MGRRIVGLCVELAAAVFGELRSTGQRLSVSSQVLPQLGL